MAESVIGFSERPIFISGPICLSRFIDIRVTIVPAIFGVKTVMKITRRDDIIRTCSDIGFEAEQRLIVTEL